MCKYTAKMASTSQMSGEKPPQKKGKRPGRKPVKIDVKAKLERSRQSARECRARKKLRYQYIEELVANREKAVFALREELQTCKEWCEQLDSGFIAEELKKIVLQEKAEKEEEIKKEQSYLPFSTNSMPLTQVNTLEPVYSQSGATNCSSSSQQYINQTKLSQPMNKQCLNSSQGASNTFLQGHRKSPVSYMPSRPNVSELSEKDQIYSWYLFLKDDEERFARDGPGSGTGTPQPLEVGTSSSVPSVVTDYLDISNSSDSSVS